MGPLSNNLCVEEAKEILTGVQRIFPCPVPESFQSNRKDGKVKGWEDGEGGLNHRLKIQ